jgi:hypothetical protein
MSRVVEKETSIVALGANVPVGDSVSVAVVAPVILQVTIAGVALKSIKFPPQFLIWIITVSVPP